MKKILVILVVICIVVLTLVATCKAQIALPTSYMWQEPTLDASIFEVTQDPKDPYSFRVILHENKYKDHIRIEIYRSEDWTLYEQIYAFSEQILVSPILKFGKEHAFTFRLNPFRGVYDIMFESVSLDQHGEADENKLINIVHQLTISGKTMQIIDELPLLPE